MYNTKYILAFSNDLNQFYEIFFDFLDYTGPIMNIYGEDGCLILRNTTGDENKLQPILGTEAQITVHVGPVSVDGIEYANDTLTINDLIAEQDNAIRITVYREKDYTKSIFQGFVVVEDNNQPLLDPPFTLSLRALDGLGLLKNVDMTDANGELFSGRLSIVDWIGNILYKTGQTLNMRFYFPFYPNTGTPDIGQSLEKVYLDAVTFMQGELIATTDPGVDVFASEADDAYIALEKIIRCLCCRLFQEDGVWNIVSLYSYMNPDGYNYTESAMDALVGGLYTFKQVANGAGKTYDINIGSDQIIHPTEDDAVLYLKLATKWVKRNYNYDQSLNKICNQGLIQGNPNAAYDELISDEIIDPSYDVNTDANLLTTKGYELFCWDHFNGTTNSSFIYPPSTPTASAFIRVVYDLLGYENVRFGVIDNSGVANTFSFVRSTKVIADTNDVVQVSFSWRYRNNFTVTNAIGIAAIYLYGDDGSRWVLRCVNDNAVYNSSGNVSFKTAWVEATSDPDRFGTPPGGGTIYIQTDDLTGTNIATWQTVSINQTLPDKLPVNGEIEIIIVNQYSDAGNELWFKDLSVTILPYLQGSYIQVKGDYNFSSTNNNIKKTDSGTVEISDSPKRYFKGALVDSTGELIKPDWHRSGKVEHYRFTQLMERVVFNNLCRINQKIEGTFRGLTYTDPDDLSSIKQAGFINSYFFSDHDTPTKKFILTSFEKDYTTGRGRHVFVEVLSDQNDTGWLDPAVVGQYVFQYIFQ